MTVALPPVGARPTRPSRRGWFWRLLPKLYVVALVANGLRLRRRAERLARLAPAPTAAGGEDPGDPASTDGWLVITSAGVEVDGPTRSAAIDHAERLDLAVVDLIPGDLPVERALDTLRMVEPGTFRSDPLAPGRGAFAALVVRADVVDRAQLDRSNLTDLDAVQMVEVTATLKRFAATATDLAVAPTLKAAPDDLGPEQRMGRLRAIFGGAAPAAVVVQAVELAGLGAGVGADARWGSLAVAAYVLQPRLVFTGVAAGLAPRDLRSGALGLDRIRTDVRSWSRTVTSRWRSPAEVDLHEARRPFYDAALTDGLERFFEPRRDTCPWCGHGRLAERVRVQDRLQHKPGEFVLDQCCGCAHIFQNPRLSIDGLNFYYEDFYDGIGGEQLEFIFGASSRPYTGRAETVKAHTTPERWLDVGAGHGHFCLVARDYWPDTVFDGLDMSESIEEAERRGWIDRGYRGMFPDLAPDIAGRYDVVSMHHYLEHTREPFAELDAAVTTLRTGGHLLIELPDPESRWGRLLGNLWLPWFQPQHQHLMPIGNLKKALEARGFTIVAEDRGEAEQPVDLLAAAWFLIDGFAPPSNLPWRPRGGVPAKVKRTVAVVGGIPLLVVGLLLDNLLDAAMRRTQGGNTFRLLARLDGPSVPAGGSGSDGRSVSAEIDADAVLEI